MTVYLVGGAVRDELLGRPAGDRDWVVVGETEQSLLDAGYRRVGQSFPVFLHPRTGEEYALARTERKIGDGHTAFACAFGPEVTLEQDLERRDLTINAMARSGSGELVDPYGGRADLEARVLRHVSAAFAEDPLRVLRVARFAAQLAEYGFRVHPDTGELLARMSRSGELDELTPERVWNETERALASPAPVRFFEVLADCGALGALFDPLARLPPDAQHTLDRAAGLGVDVVFAALCASLGDAARGLRARLRLPTGPRDLARLAIDFGAALRRFDRSDPSARLDALERVDALRRPQRFDALLDALGCVAGQPPLPLDAIRGASVALGRVDAAAAASDPSLGPDPRVRVRAAREAALARACGLGDGPQAG